MKNSNVRYAGVDPAQMPYCNLEFETVGPSLTIPDEVLSIAEIDKKYASMRMPLPPIPDSLPVGSEESFDDDNFDNPIDGQLYLQEMLEKRRFISELAQAKRNAHNGRQKDVHSSTVGDMQSKPSTSSETDDTEAETK